MKKFLVLLCALLVTTSSVAQAVAGSAGSNEDSPSADRLPACPDLPGWSNHDPGNETPSPEELESAPMCRSVGKPVVYANRPAPHAGPGYHYNGAVTNSRYQGGSGAMTVSNPAVDHRSPGPQEMVVSRFLASRNLDGSNWLEVGWAEISWDVDKQFVYTFTDADSVWRMHKSYALSVGGQYYFRVERCVLTSPAGSCAYIFWGGAWNLLWSVAGRGCVYEDSSNTSARCYVEEYVEVYSEDTTPHPNLGTSITMTDTAVKQNGTYIQWTVSSTKTSMSPYVACWTNNYYRFTVKMTSC